MALVVTLVGCIDSKTKLKNEVNSANKSCPISMGVMGELSAFTYDEKENNVSIFFTLSEDFVDFNDLKGVEDSLLQSFKLSASKGSMQKITKEIIDAGASLTLVLTSSADPSQKVEVTLSLEDLKDSHSSTKTDAEINDELIANQIKMEMERVPYVVDEGMTMVKVTDDGKNINYFCEIDENLYDMDVISELKSEMKKEMSAAFDDPAMKKFAENILSANRGIIYHYQGSQSGTDIIIVFTPSDLRSIIN